MGKKYILKLYILGSSETSAKAILNLKAICDSKLKGLYKLEVVDVMRNPQLAEDEKIFATPTLDKKLPIPIRRVIGDLSNRDKVLIGLDIAVKK